MHPSPAFRSGAAEADLLARAERIGFAHVFAATPAGPMVVHAPVTLQKPADGRRKTAKGDAKSAA